MNGGNFSQNLHAVVITGLKDPTKVDKVASALSCIIKNMSPDKIEGRLSSLPWTLTGRATPENASRLARFLDKAGTRIKIEPPLDASVTTNIPLMQARLGTVHRADRPVSASTEDIPVHERSRFQPRAGVSVEPPPPIEPGHEIALLTAPPQRSTSPQQVFSEGRAFLIEPLSLGGILDRTFQICRGYFWKLFAMQAVSGAAGILFGIGTMIVTSAAVLPVQASTKKPPWELLPIGVVLLSPIAVLALFVVLFLTHGAIIHAVSSVYLGRDIQVRESFSFAWSRLRRLFFAFMSVIFIFIGLLLVGLFAGMIILAIFNVITSSIFWGTVLALPLWIALAYIPTYAFFRLMVVDAAIIVEDLGASDAFKRSWNLISGKAEGGWPRGYLLRAIILFHLFILIAVAIHVLVEGPAYLTGLILPKTVAEILREVLSNLGGVIAGIFNSVSGVVFYYDIRNRKEGFDLGMLAGTRDRS